MAVRNSPHFQSVHFSSKTKELRQSEDFVYLGEVLSHDLSCDKDISSRIGLADGIVRSLHKVWEAKDITKATKVLLYQLYSTTQKLGP